MSLSSLSLLNDIFVQSPGDFLYFLVVMVLNLISLVMSFSLKGSEDKAVQRYTFALVGVVFAWSLMFAGVVFIRVTNQSSTAILPPLERAVTAATLILLGWAFLTADHQRLRQSSNSVVLGILLLIAVAYAISGIVWVEIAGQQDFNLSSFGLGWTLALFAIPVLGILATILLFSDVVDAPLKLVYFVLVALGGGLTVYQMSQNGLIGNYTGVYRMTFTLAQILVPLIVYRIVVAQYELQLRDRTIRGSTPIPAPEVKSPPPSPPPAAPRVSHTDALNAQLLKAMGMILETGEPDEIPRHIVGTVLDVMRADVGALLRLQDMNYADISIAQDRMMGRKISGMSLNFDNQPTLVNAVERRAQRGLYPDRNVEEVDDLYERLYIEQRGPVYFQPLTHNREVLAVLMIGMPYTKRELRSEEVELLKGVGAIAGSLLAVSYNSIEAAQLAEDRIIQAMVEGVAPSVVQETSTTVAREDMQQKLAEARAEIDSLHSQVVELNRQLQGEHNRLAELMGDTTDDLGISQRIVAITDEQMKLREERETLAQRLRETETALQGAGAADHDSVMTHLIETLREEKESLVAERNRLQTQLDELRAQDKSFVPADVQRLINRMMQEKSSLEQERDQLNHKLQNVETELTELGLQDSVTGLSQWISQLSEERVTLKQQNALLQKERDMLLNEREAFQDKLSQEKSRDAHILSLQDKIEKLASDREIAIKQRDKLRAERAEMIKAVNKIKEHRARLMAAASGVKVELDEALEEQAQLRAQIQELADAKSQLVHARDKLVAENTALANELEQALTRLTGDASTDGSVNDEAVASLREMVETLSQQRNELEHELNQSKSQLAALEQKLEAAKDLTEANGTRLEYEPNEPELLVGLVQELRTPMTSISGYIELLLSESAGILGEMQRKFLHRVGANIARLDSMIDSLINVTQLDTGNYRLEPHPVDFIHLIEEAITSASLQFREKGLAVTLDIDDGMPSLPADEDAMKQVIGQLLTNAYLVSPPDSDIHVTAVRRSMELEDEEEAPRNCLYVAIQDSGGGISQDDVPRVFARKYKAENPLIEGLGDTGVGMSIAKALIDAHEGRLWVETNDGVGSTFAFAIPLDLEPQTKRD